MQIKPHFKLITSLIIIILMTSQSLTSIEAFVQAISPSVWPSPPLRLTFPNNIIASANSWNPTQIIASVPAGVSDGPISVETAFGGSNDSPFVVGSSFTPDDAGEAATWNTSFSGNIATDTIWDENILITGDVTVPGGVTLTIQPGVTVFFNRNSDDQANGLWTDKTEIHVYGTLIAEGTEINPIYFTSTYILKRAGDWGAIVIRKDGNLSLANCVIHYAEYGVYYYTLKEGSGTLSGTVQHCTITDNTSDVK